MGLRREDVNLGMMVSPPFRLYVYRFSNLLQDASFIELLRCIVRDKQLASPRKVFILNFMDVSELFEDDEFK